MTPRGQRSRRRLRTRSGLAALLAGAAVTIGPAPAVSAMPIDDGGGYLDATHHNRPIGQVCRTRYRHHPHSCRGRVHVHLSHRHRVDRRTAHADAGYVNGSGETLLHAFNRHAKTGGTIWSVTWYQRAYTYHWWDLASLQLYNSHQHGKAYYDGQDVWVDSDRRGTDPGNHLCYADRSVLFDVTIDNCWENWMTDDSGHEYTQMWDEFTISALLHGVPVWRQVQIHANVHANGLVTFWFHE
jgi:hypothetical protein